MRNGTRRLLEYVALAAVLAVSARMTHLWITDRLSVLRAVYPLQSLAVRWHIRCSPDAPAWLSQVSKFAVDKFGALAGQVAYKAPDGVLHHCEHGWVGGMLSSTPVNSETRFRYASLTKLVTADSVLRRVNQQRLSVNDPVAKWVPAWQSDLDPRVFTITIDQLLRHQGGFDRLKRPDPMTEHNQRPWCPSDLGQARQLKLDFAPGARRAYANLGYCLLGVVLERLDGLTYRDIMEADHGLAARGMRFVDGLYLPDEVQYDFRNSPFYDETYPRYFDFGALSSSAGLSGSAKSLAELLQTLMQRRPLSVLSGPDQDCSADTVQGCRTLGAALSRWSDSPWVLHSHGGTLYGLSAQAVMDNAGGVLVMLGNGMPLNWDDVSHDFLLAVHALYRAHRAPPAPSMSH